MKKKVLPTRVMRWCCDVFKEGHGAGKVKLIGIRHEESVRRAKRQELEVTSYKFSGTQEEFAKWQEEQRAKQLEQMKKRQEQFDIDQESLVKCVGGKDSIIVSPIIDWTERDVWEFLNEVVKVPHCELYDTGHHRIGCLFCPMSTKRNLLRECREYPHQRHRWIETIKEMRRNGAMLNLDEHIDLSGYSEDEVAEFIFDWWISKKNSKEYVADKFLQQTINFD